MPLTQSMIKEFTNLARAANRRLERATSGQRSYLQSKISKYHIRERKPGVTVFSQAKPKTMAEYHSRMNELRAFMGAATSTRRGWEAVKRAQVSSAGKTLRAGGSNITDDELALILMEIGEGHSSAEFYKALDNVEISKRERGDKWTPSADTISDAINSRRSAQERAKLLIKLRGK